MSECLVAPSNDIPYLTPRSSRSPGSTTASLPQIPAASLSSRRSDSVTPSRVFSLGHHASQSLDTHTPSIPSFRSLRNLLPFGPLKTPNKAPITPAKAPKSPFITFGTFRRSISGDRREVSGQEPREDPKPVIIIGGPHDTFDNSIEYNVAYNLEDSIVSPCSSPSHDLSTIVEADNSGVSRNAQPLEIFNDDECGDSSALDLSTSKLDAEVRDALTKAPEGTEWFNDTQDNPLEDRPLARTGKSDGNERQFDSLNLASLDPDLVALLSPGSDTAPTGLRINPAISPIRPPYSSQKHGDEQQRQCLGDAQKLISQSISVATEGSEHPNGSSDFLASHEMQRSSSLSKSFTSRWPRHNHRLMRSVTDVPGQLRLSPTSTDFTNGDGASGHAAHAKRRPHLITTVSSLGRASLDETHITSQSSGSKTLHPLVQSHGRSPYRPVESPLLQPGRSLSPAFDLEPDVTITDVHSTRPMPDHLHSHLSALGVGRPSHLDLSIRRRAHLPRNRKRSMSLEESRPPTAFSTLRSSSPIMRPSSSSSVRPPNLDWLGPRTAKAFAAAGLLDDSRVSAINSPRHSPSRTSSEQESPSYPSRPSLTETGSNSSWSRSGATSRTMTASELGNTWNGSPTFSSAPRTSFSACSSTPTSVSASSSQQQTVLQLMKEKHDLETEALLAALSDSQRSSKILREENTQLRERIHELELQVNSLQERLHRPSTPQMGQPLSSSRAMSDYTAPSVTSYPHLSHTRPSRSSSLTATLSLDRNDNEERKSFNPHNESAAKFHRRRSSTTSSIFPNPPPNMTMLMLEEIMPERAGTFSTLSVSPPSPSLAVPRRSSSIKHSQQRVVSPAKDISPTTADFSMTETTGSPRSLYLRPEHELHLGDMASLDLRAGSDEE